MMTFYIIGAMYGCVLLWVIYEFWIAPLMKENEDGSWTEIKPIKKAK